MSTIRMMIGDKIREFVTIGELAKRAAMSGDYLMKLEERGILPTANFRAPDVPKKDGTAMKGARVYTVELADKVAAVLKKERPGTGHKFAETTLQKLRDLFSQELNGQL